MLQWELKTQSTCPVPLWCGMEEESMGPLFFNCEFAKMILLMITEVGRLCEG